MTSSRPNQTTRTPHGTGAHRPHHRSAPRATTPAQPTASGPSPRRPERTERAARTDGRTEGGERAEGSERAERSARFERYEAQLDGLFTYCLSVLCDHDAATAALADALAVADRQRSRAPEHASRRTAWLYAIARWTCLRRLAEGRSSRQGAPAGRHAGRPTGRHSGRPAARHTAAKPAPAPSPSAPPAASAVSAASAAYDVDEGTAAHRRAQLALLAWPEAAGTTPEQREALELAVRHGLAPREVAAVLGLPDAAARDLLATAACEVERTRAALAVVEAGACPSVAHLTGDHGVLLSAALRTELVRHVDDCPRCRRAAERAGAHGPWPGATPTPATLPLVPAPRAALRLAAAHAPRTRPAAPRFGPTGFPLDPKDQAARRDRLRARAVTTTVVAAVVAAPVLALWAAYRGAPLTGESRQAGPSVTATDEGTGNTDAGPADRYENAGNADTADGHGSADGTPAPDVSVEVLSPGAGASGPGRLTLTAEPHQGATRLTLTASGGAPVTWSVRADAGWLRLSSASGVLHPGESTAVYVTVDPDREPAGAWSARVAVAPSGAVVRIDGRGAPKPPTHRPTRPVTPRPSPTPPTTPSPTPSSPSPTPSPTVPSPTPSPTEGSPSPSEPPSDAP
ncbi:hypothetical protein [Streptomyces sp. NPDC047315]|uniref:BACON domain-containing protein n=1 Tax=Streptomyces sp. NPDC047315 TaxID=3155142 RepID=UPI0033CF0702